MEGPIGQIERPIPFIAIVAIVALIFLGTQGSGIVSDVGNSV